MRPSGRLARSSARPARLVRLRWPGAAVPLFLVAQAIVGVAQAAPRARAAGASLPPIWAASRQAREGPAGWVVLAGRATHHGTADVAYAGSLLKLNEKVVGPAFTKLTGYGYSGRGAGALALSQEIISGEIAPNVFESIGAAPIAALEPKFTGWYVQFAASPLVLAYNPKSTYGPQLRAIARGKRPVRDLFSLMQKPGFELGRTDPNLDPQGQGFIEMIELAQKLYRLPPESVHAILGRGALGGSSSREIYDETDLEARLQAGQLDASSAYLSQAVQLHLPYITLPESINLGSPADARAYAKAAVRLGDGKVVHGSPLVVDITTIGPADAAADAFVAYVLSPAGRSEHKAGGYTLLKPRLFGSRAHVPAPVLDELAS